MAPPQGPDLSEWLADFVAEAGSDSGVKEFATYVDAAILEQIPDLASDPALAADLSASTRSQWKSFLTVVERETQEVVLPPQAVDLALSIARRGMDLGILLKVYRVAGDATWEYIVKVVDAIPPAAGLDQAEVLKFLWGRAGRWINESVEQLILAYLSEREARLHGALARRHEIVQAILRGEPIGIDQAAEELGHKLRASQTCLVLWFDEAPADQSPAALESLAKAIAREVDAPHPMTHMAGRRELWAWIATRMPLDPGRITELVASAGARATIGRSGPGVDGFRISHFEAVDAERFVVASSSASTVTSYAEVELACLISKNPDAARRLVERELGALASDDPALDPVRQTLGHYLRSGSNIALTAKELFVHRNTVRYRLAQAEELVDHPLTKRRTEMDLALRLLDWWPGGPAT